MVFLFNRDYKNQERYCVRCQPLPVTEVTTVLDSHYGTSSSASQATSISSHYFLSFNGVYLNHSCFNKACTNSSIGNITVTCFQ